MEELPQQDADLMRRAHEAARNAYAPYSKFQVGAAARLSNGAVVTGNNIENAAYPSGLCAERVTLFAFFTSLLLFAKPQTQGSCPASPSPTSRVK